MKIICKISKEDKYESTGEYIDLNLDDDGVFTYTFWSKLPKLTHFLSNIGLDFLYISLFVYGVDRLIVRESALDCWTRDFELDIPVLNKERWDENKELLQSMLSFLSGDSWKFNFRKRELYSGEIKKQKEFYCSELKSKEYETICMFSGGIDSFIGAIDILEKDKHPKLFVSHYGGGKGTKEYQDLLKEKICEEYDVNKEDFCSFYAVAKNGVEDTTRTRSFMFFSHAIALATCLDKKVSLIIPENGLISLNIPLTFSRLGTSSTRTTHPYYLGLLQRLLDNMKCQVELINPYQFYTKGEMISNCMNQKFLSNNLHNTMSCSHPDQGRVFGETEPCHCGYCLPCVIRKAAIKRANVLDNSNYRDDKFTKYEVARENLNSYMLGLAKYAEKYAFLNIQSSGPIVRDIERYTDLYARGMNELKCYLEEINESV
jgi:7-cyano-7-deazaguanine synthase in queuosine biosynthesis